MRLCHACKILLVEANSNNNGDLGAAVNRGRVARRQDRQQLLRRHESSDRPTGRATTTTRVSPSLLRPVTTAGTTGTGSISVSPPTTLRRHPRHTAPSSASAGRRSYLNPNGTRASETVWNDNGPVDARGLRGRQHLGYGPAPPEAVAAPSTPRDLAAARQPATAPSVAAATLATASTSPPTPTTSPVSTSYESYDWCTSDRRQRLHMPGR